MCCALTELFARVTGINKENIDKVAYITLQGEAAMGKNREIKAGEGNRQGTPDMKDTDNLKKKS